MADTLKAQYTAYLTKGHCCYSDMGRILVSIAEDTCGWHDTFCGVSSPEEVAAQYGVARYQEARNDWYRSGRDSLLKELGKWGLGLPDLVANVNFFSKVAVSDTGPGVDPARALGEKRGLYHLQQRIAELGGTLELARSPAGFTARAEFPAGR